MVLFLFGSGMNREAAVSSEGLRYDGRRPLEHRRIECRVSGLAGDGSAFFSLGNTHVAAAVFGPREQRGSRTERATIVAEVHVAAFASQVSGRDGKCDVN